MPEVGAALRAEIRSRANKHKGTDLHRLIRKPERWSACSIRVVISGMSTSSYVGQVVSRTSIGRVTIRLLQLNRLERIAERDLMLRAGLLLL